MHKGQAETVALSIPCCHEDNMAKDALNQVCMADPTAPWSLGGPEMPPSKESLFPDSPAPRDLPERRFQNRQAPPSRCDYDKHTAACPGRQGLHAVDGTSVL